MSSLLFRRLRGILGMATLGAVVWAPVGVLLAVGWLFHSGVVLPQQWSWWPFAARVAAIYAMWGAVAGAAFALVLMTAERSKDGVRSLTVGRAASWGAVAPSVLLLAARFAPHRAPWKAVGIVAQEIPWVAVAVVGAGIAAAAVALARRASPKQLATIGRPETGDLRVTFATNPEGRR